MSKLDSAGKTPIKAQTSTRDCAYAVPGKTWQMPAKGGSGKRDGMDQHLRSDHDQCRGGLPGKC